MSTRIKQMMWQLHGNAYVTYICHIKNKIIRQQIPLWKIIKTKTNPNFSKNSFIPSLSNYIKIPKHIKAYKFLCQRYLFLHSFNFAIKHFREPYAFWGFVSPCYELIKSPYIFLNIYTQSLWLGADFLCSLLPH